MGQPRTDNFKTNAPKLVDARYYKDGYNTPYASRQEAFDLIYYKAKKLSCAVMLNGVETECWFKDSFSSPSDLVIKNPIAASSSSITDYYLKSSNTLYNILDQYTGEPITYKKVTTWIDGSSMDDSKVDGIIFIKVGSEYFKRVYTVLNAKWFGATGNGSTDDYLNCSKAIAMGQATKGTVFFPKGIYQFNTGSDAYTIFTINGGDNLRLQGEEGTVFRTALYGPADNTENNILRFQYGAKNVVVDSIAFINTHPYVLCRTLAITTLQGGGTFYPDMKISNCNFTGFSTAITTQGTKRLSIDRCKFYHPLGRDNSKSNSEPAVDIWFVTANNGDNEDAEITRCYGEGYSGTDIATTVNGTAFDGFLYGKVNGLLFADNQLAKYAIESVFLQTFNNTTTTKPLVFQRNIIDCKPVAGSGANITWGMRIDQSNVISQNNIITNFDYGIWVYGFGSTWKFKNINISANTLKPNPASGDIQPIFVQGNAANPIENVNISGNSLTIDGNSLTRNINLIALADAVSSSITDNYSYANNVTKNGFKLTVVELANVCDVIKLNNKEPLGSSIDATYSFKAESILTNITYGDLNQLTTAQINALVAPVAGSFVYNKTINGLMYHDGTSFVEYQKSLGITNKVIIFTPTAIGWYRIIASGGTSGGVVKIQNNDYDSTQTDVEFQFNIGGYGTGGSIQQTRFSSFNNGVIDQVRISSTGANVFCDIHVRTATSPLPIKLNLSGNNMYGVTTSPVVGAVVGDTDAKILVLGHGFRTTNTIVAANAVQDNELVTLLQLNEAVPVNGIATRSGDGAATTFAIAHGLGNTPELFMAQGATSAAKNISFVTADATDITVHYDVAPPSGVNNLLIIWQAKLSTIDI